MNARFSMCEYDKLVGRFHDAELDEAQSAQMRKHLLECGPCAENLAALRRVSGFIGNIPLEGITGIERARMLRICDKLPASLGEGAMIRMGASLAALAASLLLVTSLWLAGVGGSTARAQSISGGPLALTGSLIVASHANAAGEDQANANLSHWMVRNLGGDLP